MNILHRLAAVTAAAFAVALACAQPAAAACPSGSYSYIATSGQEKCLVGKGDGTVSERVVALGSTTIASATFTTPSGTTAYASGDLIADSGTAGSVTPMSFTVCTENGGSGMIRRVRIKTTDTGFASASVRLHLYRDSPTVTNGDNGAWLSTESNYIGAFDVTLDRHFSDSEKGLGAPMTGTEINFQCATGTRVIYGLLEARGAITPVGAKPFTIVEEVLAN